MGSVIPLKKNTENSYLMLRELVKEKLTEVDAFIKNKLTSILHLRESI